MEGFQGWLGLLVYLCKDVASTLLVVSCLGALILKILDPLLRHLENLWHLLQHFQVRKRDVLIVTEHGKQNSTSLIVRS